VFVVLVAVVTANGGAAVLEMLRRNHGCAIAGFNVIVRLALETI
jgi:hypothetical protein